ncbi:MAG: diaminopimelate dehydrogenase [bacterium]
MNSTSIAIVGYGNIGRGVHESIKRNDDMELSGILTRGPKRVREELSDAPDRTPPIVDASKTMDFGQELPADVAILCGGSKDDLPVQGPKFAKHYNVVDSFDTHADIPDYYDEMDKISSENDQLAVVSTGWDPGTFSLERVLADAFIPGADHYTFWGPGVSQGHSDAARQIEGVKDARQYTLPIDEAIERVRNGERPELETSEKHTREVYVVIEDGADKDRIEREIVEMPNYFEPYDTTVEFISEDEMERNHDEYPHGGFVMASGKTGSEGNKALIEYNCDWDSNPEATANILIAHARAASRMSERGEDGARTILEIQPADLSPYSRDELLSEFM